MLGTNLKMAAVVVGTLAVFTWVANAIPQVASEVPEDVSFGADVSEAELVSAGETLYSGGGACVSCHGLGERAPNLLTDHEGLGTIGQRCADRVPGEDCKTYLYNSMVAPNDYMVEGFLPIMLDQSRTLSQNQIWALVAYLQAQGGTVTVTGADLQSGAEAAAAPAPAAATGGPATTSTDPVEILEANLCFTCHVLDDQGTEIGPSFNGIGSRVSVDYIRTSILDPASEASPGYEQLQGAMLNMFGDQLTANQLEIVVQYLANRR